MLGWLSPKIADRNSNRLEGKGTIQPFWLSLDVTITAVGTAGLHNYSPFLCYVPYANSTTAHDHNIYLRLLLLLFFSSNWNLWNLASIVVVVLEIHVTKFINHQRMKLNFDKIVVGGNFLWCLANNLRGTCDFNLAISLWFPDET